MFADETNLPPPDGGALNDVFSIETAALAATIAYGPQARTAVAWCGIQARCAGRLSDFRFWAQVFRYLGRSDEQNAMNSPVDGNPSGRGDDREAWPSVEPGESRH
ncbi:hypothetical protein DTW90_25390 [Neorhizobium sp. P12A]|jgi:hypothetical protein|uniref:hypothetical protein n=1 Tax=Neorhizobium sp. P12A TaxID=2268027 RepID=UPI0011EFB407|nr:hypothetical protein [Neorhizobium sp. P12A]KAA0693711.1 hypothetical protein DTW90_25390 [Neorhizobium sp. P12A]